jgi:hypothetical protein
VQQQPEAPQQRAFAFRLCDGGLQTIKDKIKKRSSQDKEWLWCSDPPLESPGYLLQGSQLVKPVAVELVICMGVGGCRWPSLLRVTCNGMASSWPLTYEPAILASVAEVMTSIWKHFY